MDIAVTLCIALGVSCAAIASAKHRSVFGWLVIGSLIPLVGLVLILVLPAAVPSIVIGANRAPHIAPAAAPTLSDVDDDARAHLMRTTVDAMARLASLKDQGAITSREFDEKKAELLARL